MPSLSDRALKERIIGAVVLVIFAVLVVPVFLDGPTNENEMISEVVTLPGQNNQERKRQTIVLEQNRSEPVPAVQAPVQTTREVQEPVKSETPAVVPEKPSDDPETTASEQSVPDQAAAPEVEAKPPAAPPANASETQSTTGMWAVQLGSFSEQENAERLAASLRDQGYAAFLSQLKTGSANLHRVRVGPQKDRESAERIAAQLAKGGHKGQVVPHP